MLDYSQNHTEERNSLKNKVAKVSRWSDDLLTIRKRCSNDPPAIIKGFSRGLQMTLQWSFSDCSGTFKWCLGSPITTVKRYYNGPSTALQRILNGVCSISLTAFQRPLYNILTLIQRLFNLLTLIQRLYDILTLVFFQRPWYLHAYSGGAARFSRRVGKRLVHKTKRQTILLKSRSDKLCPPSPCLTFLMNLLPKTAWLTSLYVTF